MNFNQASTQLATLIEDLKDATTNQARIDADRALLFFRADHLSGSDPSFATLRKLAQSARQEYIEALPETMAQTALRAIQGRTQNYVSLVNKLKAINEQSPAALLPHLDKVTSLLTSAEQVVSTINKVKEVGIDHLDQQDLAKIDEALDILTKLPERVTQ